MPKGYKTAKTRAKETAEMESLQEIAVDAKRVIQEMARVALVDARSFWNPDGSLKPIHELTADQGAAIAGFEAIIKNAEAGDGKQDKVHKIKLWDKPRALEMLGKHFKLLTDKFEITGDKDLAAALIAGRQRAKKRS